MSPDENETQDVSVFGSLDGDAGQRLDFKGQWNLEQLRDALHALEAANLRIRQSRSVGAMIVTLELLPRA